MDILQTLAAANRFTSSRKDANSKRSQSSASSDVADTRRQKGPIIVKAKAPKYGSSIAPKPVSNNRVASDTDDDEDEGSQSSDEKDFSHKTHNASSHTESFKGDTESSSAVKKQSYPSVVQKAHSKDQDRKRSSQHYSHRTPQTSFPKSSQPTNEYASSRAHRPRENAANDTRNANSDFIDQPSAYTQEYSSRRSSHTLGSRDRSRFGVDTPKASSPYQSHSDDNNHESSNEGRDLESEGSMVVFEDILDSSNHDQFNANENPNLVSIQEQEREKKEAEDFRSALLRAAQNDEDKGGSSPWQFGASASHVSNGSFPRQPPETRASLFDEYNTSSVDPWAQFRAKSNPLSTVTQYPQSSPSMHSPLKTQPSSSTVPNHDQTQTNVSNDTNHVQAPHTDNNNAVGFQKPRTFQKVDATEHKSQEITPTKEGAVKPDAENSLAKVQDTSPNPPKRGVVATIKNWFIGYDPSTQKTDKSASNKRIAFVAFVSCAVLIATIVIIVKWRKARQISLDADASHVNNQEGNRLNQVQPLLEDNAQNYTFNAVENVSPLALSSSSPSAPKEADHATSEAVGGGNEGADDYGYSPPPHPLHQNNIPRQQNQTLPASILRPQSALMQVGSFGIPSQSVPVDKPSRTVTFDYGNDFKQDYPSTLGHDVYQAHEELHAQQGNVSEDTAGHFVDSILNGTATASQARSISSRFSSHNGNVIGDVQPKNSIPPSPNAEKTFVQKPTSHPSLPSSPLESRLQNLESMLDDIM